MSDESTGTATWTPTPEDLDQRTMRALREAMTVTRVAPGLFEVRRPTGTTYQVDLQEPACPCSDFTYRELQCKHIRRVRLATDEALRRTLRSDLAAALDSKRTQLERLQATQRNLESAIEETEQVMAALDELCDRRPAEPTQ